MYLHEEILLLVLKEDSGKVDWKAGMYNFVMAGAMVAELLLAESVVLADTRKKRLRITDSPAHPDPVLNEALAAIAASGKERDIRHWIMKLARLKQLKEKTARALCRQGVLREEESRVLLFFTTHRYPQIDPEPKREILARIRDAIFGEGEVDVRTAVLVSLCHQPGLLKIHFSGKELRRHKKRLKDIAAGNNIGNATNAAIEEVQAAMAVAAVLPAITAASTAGATGSRC